MVIYLLKHNWPVLCLYTETASVRVADVIAFINPPIYISKNALLRFIYVQMRLNVQYILQLIRFVKMFLWHRKWPIRSVWVTGNMSVGLNLVTAQWTCPWTTVQKKTNKIRIRFVAIFSVNLFFISSFFFIPIYIPFFFFYFLFILFFIS